jgi:hypothetical protein
MCENNNAMLATSNYNQSDRFVHHFLLLVKKEIATCQLSKVYSKGCL